MARTPGSRKQKQQATFEDGSKKPNTKLQKRLDGLMRVIEDTSKPHQTRLNSAKKYAEAMRTRKSANLKQEIDPEALVQEKSGGQAN
mmetsp:Transcript_12686/g.34621  ORF Transcript_12686/g.34621 Transcript_12686/m.34621 type:complete len:87 (+) Transcript_12686:83-343(+)